MRISADTHPGPWQVFRRGELVKNVVWIDPDTRQWAAYVEPLQFCPSGPVETVHQARKVEINGWRIEIDAPDVPFEAHNWRAIDPDRAITAMRAMCRDYRSVK